MTPGWGLVRALLVTLATPTTWPLALGSFLVRGGIVLVALPILVLPTPAGLGTALAPSISSIAFGTFPLAIAVVIGAIVAGVVTWLVAGGWAAALLEAEGTRIVASDEEVGDLRWPIVAAPAGRVASRIFVVRLLACLPLGVVLAVGSIRLVFVTYHELTAPLDVTTPIVLRVLRAAPEVVVAVGLAWMLAEIIGAIASREITLRGARAGHALRHAIATLARRPVKPVIDFVVPMIVVWVALLCVDLATSAAWAAVGSVLGERSDPIAILLAVGAFVGLWIVGLVLISVACAWRAAVWTLAAVSGEGTFGRYPDRRPGHWQPDDPSATL
ncbi:MAG TPA: hypothetical protein VGO15_06715 [Candidatus Limnocylindrales bacterium]|nr:hypothetical protein [Candidatus Limnocylindrales bacterium]